MAMRALPRMLRRRAAVYATKTSRATNTPKIKQRTPESLDVGSLEVVDRPLSPFLEQTRKRYQEECRIHRRKAWAIAAAGYATLGYLVTSAYRAAAAAKN